MKSVALVLILIFSGCATQYVTPKIPIPPEPAYVTVKAHEYQCMADEPKERLKIKVTQLKNYIEELKAILEPYQ